MKSIINYIGTTNFLFKILFPAFLTIILFVATIFQIMIPHFERTILDRKREMILELTNSAYSIIEYYQRLTEKGEITVEKAKSEAINKLRNLRYGEDLKDYFWVTDLKPIMIMHPYRSELEGEDLSEFKDSHGKKLFVEMVNVVQEKGEGFVDYWWQWKDDSTRIVPKLSYVRKFNEWGWIIGTGIYIEDVKQEIASIERNLINISIAIVLIVSLLLVFITIQNINTEKKRREIENELRASKEKYKALVEVSTDGLILILDGKKIFFNKTLLSMLGYSYQEFVNLSIDEIIVTNFKEDIFSDYTQLETQLKKRDGSLLDVLLTISPITVNDKEGTIITVKDISQHKEIEEALGETREKYLALTNQLTLGVFRADITRNFKFIEVNPAVLNILAVQSYDQIYNFNITDFFEDRYEGKIFWNELINTGIIKNKIVQIRRLDSELAIVSISIVLVKDSSGQPRYCDGIIEDITESKKTEEERESLISELQLSLTFLNQAIKPLVKDHLVVDINSPVSKVGQLMTIKNSKTALVKTSTNEIIGIITDGDIRQRVLSSELSSQTPAYQIMSSPLYTININSTVLEAMLKFYEKDIEQLVVKDDENNVCGILNLTDVHEANQLAYLFFIKKIQTAISISEIIKYRNKLLILIKALIEGGTSIQNVTRLITFINDNITARIISLAIEELGEPPAKFVFVTFGSEGRKEQTLVTDQDNGIIYEDIDSEKGAEVHNYFLKLGDLICTNLNNVGYAFCKGNVMAKNPKWCQPFTLWKKYFTSWITTANPQDLLDANIFFDIRPVYGEQSLYDKLHEHVQHIISGYNPFFLYLSQNALKFKPPINALKAGETFNIKLALVALIDLVRVYSLKNKIESTNTIERIEGLHNKNIFSKTGYQDLLQAYNFLMQVRLKHQVKLLSANLTPDNNINSKQLTDLDLTMLKRIFALIFDFQSKLNLDFKGML